LGAIYEIGVIDISLKELQAVPTSKKRKVNGKAVKFGDWSNRNPDRALLGISIEYDGCIGQKQYARLLLGDGQCANPYSS
jgi:hypothetical protein